MRRPRATTSVAQSFRSLSLCLAQLYDAGQQARAHHQSRGRQFPPPPGTTPRVVSTAPYEIKTSIKSIGRVVIIIAPRSKGPGFESWFLQRDEGLTHGRGVSGSNLLGGSSGGRDLAPEAVRFAASLWCPPPVGSDRYLRGLSGSSPRSVLIKICANKKIGESERVPRRSS